MRPEDCLVKIIRLALEKDGRARLVRNFSGLVVPYALVRRALEKGDLVGLRNVQPIVAGLGKGSADLVGMIKGSGRVVCLEVKTSTGAVRPEQPLWLAAIRRLGGFACVVRSPADAIDAVTRACAGASQ